MPSDKAQHREMNMIDMQWTEMEFQIIFNMFQLINRLMTFLGNYIL